MAGRFWKQLAPIALAGSLACGADDPSVSVVSTNRAPEIQHFALIPDAPVAGDRIRTEIRVRDADGDAVEVRYEWTVGGVPAAATGPQLLLGEVRRGTIIEAVALASDGSRVSEPSRATIQVRNRRPRLDLVRIEPWQKVAPGQLLSVAAEGSDPDGDPLRYEFEWRVNGDPVGSTGREFSTVGLASGDLVQVRARALDDRDASDPIDSAGVRIVGANPEIVSNPSEWSGDGAFRYRVEVVHPDGDRNIRFSLRAAPEGMQVDAINGEVQWRPRRNQVGTFLVAIAAEDSRGAVTIQEFELTVGAPAAPAP